MAVVLQSGGVYSVLLLRWQFSSLLQKRIIPLTQNNISSISGGIFDFGINSFSLVLTLSLFGIANGVSSTNLDSTQAWLLVLGAGIFFGIFHGGLYVITSRRFDNSHLPWRNWDSLALISIEILPVFFGFLSLLVYPLIGEWNDNNFWCRDLCSRFIDFLSQCTPEKPRTQVAGVICFRRNQQGSELSY